MSRPPNIKNHPAIKSFIAAKTEQDKKLEKPVEAVK